MSNIDTARDTLYVISRWMRLEFLSIFKRSFKTIDKRHVAIFAWALPPNSNAGVYRPLSFIQHGSTLGWRFDAFQGATPKNQSEHGEELLARIPKEVKIHVVDKSIRIPSYRLTPQIDGGFKTALALADYAIEQLLLDPPCVVLASGPPFHVFVSAYFVSKWFGVPLVLDYRDEWTECPFDFVDKGVNDRYWEGRCLAHASAVFFTTQSHIEHQIVHFPEFDGSKAYLVPNGWEPNDFISPCAQVDSKRHSTNNNFINIAHIGNLAGHTPPHDFLKALSQLLKNEPVWRERIVVHFVGRRSPEASLALEEFIFKENLRIVDHVGKKEANRLMSEADCLLLISVADLERYMPGKLFDYVAAYRPILVFGSIGEASSTVLRLGIGELCNPGTGDKLADSLQRIFEINLKDSAAVVDEWLEKHKRKNIAEYAFNKINSLIDLK